MTKINNYSETWIIHNTWAYSGFQQGGARLGKIVISPHTGLEVDILLYFIFFKVDSICPLIVNCIVHVHCIALYAVIFIKKLHLFINSIYIIIWWYFQNVVCLFYAFKTSKCTSYQNNSVICNFMKLFLIRWGYLWTSVR